MNVISRNPNYSGAPKQGAPTIPFVCYMPNFDAEELLYSIDGEPINIIDNSNSNPVLQNVASQILQELPDGGMDYTGMSDKDVVRSMPRRHLDTSELALLANNNLRQMDKDFKDYQSKND